MRTRRGRTAGPETRSPFHSNGAGRVLGAAHLVVFAVKHETRAAADLPPQQHGVCPRLLVAAEGHEGEAETPLQPRGGFLKA